MTNIARLLCVVRAISSFADVRLVQVQGTEDLWKVIVAVHDVILVETCEGTYDVILDDATRKIESMSQRIMHAVRPDTPSKS